MQKYIFYLSWGALIWMSTSCRTNMLQEDQKLLVKNTYKYEGKSVYGAITLNEFVKQRPNTTIVFFPIPLWIYDMSNKDLLEVFKAYYEIPKERRTQDTLDYLYRKFGKDQYVGQSKGLSRFAFNNGQPPVVVNEKFTQQTTKTLQNYFINKGYRHAQVNYEILPAKQLFNSDKKEKIIYHIKAGEPTKISTYTKEVEDEGIYAVIEEYQKNAKLQAGQLLDEYRIKNELSYFENALRDNGYYKFNATKENMYFESDSTQNPYEYPLKLIVKNTDSTHADIPINHIGVIKTTLATNSTSIDNDFCKKSDSVQTPTCNRLYNQRGLNFIKDTLIALRKALGEKQFENQKQTLMKHLYDYLDREGSRRKFTQYRDEVLTYPQIISPGDIYRSSEVSQTKRNYYILDNFNLRKVEEDTLNGKVNYSFQLSPKKLNRLEILSELNYSEFLSIGTTIGMEYFRRNVFRGAENLTTSLSVTLGTVSNDEAEANSQFLNAYDISFQMALSFPRWIIFNKLGLGKLKKSSPTSSINAGISGQNNIGLGRINYNMQLNYFLQPTDFITHKLSLFNTQYTNHLNPENYYDGRTKDLAYINQFLDDYYIYNPSATMLGLNDYEMVDYIFQQDPAFLNYLKEQNPDLRTQMRYVYRNKEINTQNILVNSMIYTFSYNQSRDALVDNPLNLYFKFELAGTLLNLIDKATSKNQSHEFLGVPYSQFFKVETDVRKQFTITGRSRIVTRLLFGIGIPFGVSDNLPYDRNYIAGGANDVRAWKPFALGPGDSKDEFSLGGFDNLKLLGSVEWRFPLTEVIEGALFTDLGNVWGTNKDYEYIFKFDTFYKQLGIGSGMGVRYNLGFLTLRADWAFKIYNPKYDPGERWNFDRIFKESNGLGQSRLNIAIGYPF